MPVSLPAGQAVELLDAGGVNKATISAGGAQLISGTVTANIGTGIANPLPTSDAADGTVNAAVPAKALYVAGADSAGLLQAIPVVAAGATAGHLVPVAGVDSAGLLQAIPVGPAGTAVGSAGVQLAGSDGANSRLVLTDSSGRVILGAPSANLPVADIADGTPGAAVPASALWVAGTDGTKLRGLSTDTLGRLIASPGTGVTRTSQSPGTASSSVQFGPATAQVAKWWQIWISIYTLTCTAIGSLVLELKDTASGLDIAEAELILPLTANFPPAGLQVQLAGPCDFPGAAIAGGIYTLKWSHTETASVCTGRIGALVGYQ
jgi:hypothetical protein